MKRSLRSNFLIILQLILLIFLFFSKNIALAGNKNVIEDYLKGKITPITHENCFLNFHYDKLEDEAVITEINLLSKNLNRYIISVKFSVKDENFSKNLSILSEEICSYPVFNRKIGKNDKISLEDIDFIEHKYVKDQDIIVNPEILRDMSVRRPISPGRLINNMDIIKPIIIKKDQKVNIIYSKNNMIIKVTAIALENGCVGDVIKTKNEKTGFIIHCEVQEDGNLLFKN